MVVLLLIAFILREFFILFAIVSCLSLVSFLDEFLSVPFLFSLFFPLSLPLPLSYPSTHTSSSVEEFFLSTYMFSKEPDFCGRRLCAAGEVRACAPAAHLFFHLLKVADFRGAFYPPTCFLENQTSADLATAGEVLVPAPAAHLFFGLPKVRRSPRPRASFAPLL